MPIKLVKRPQIVARSVCPRCQISTSARRLSPTTTTSPLENARFARLSNRSVIQLNGPDASEFLQGLVPAKLSNQSGELVGRPIYTVFLTAQGRISHDVFIYPPTESAAAGASDVWHIEVHAEAASDLVKHLRKHKLRSKFKMDRISRDAMAVYSVWGDGEKTKASESLAGDGAIGGIDPRPGMGSRWVLNPEEASDTLQRVPELGLQEVDLTEYTVHRMLNGIAEGQEEIIALSALPQESNIDFFDGIDFHKGCYLGQELTIRTHHTGVVRKRILPCQIYDDQHPIDPSQQAPNYTPDSSLKLPVPGSNISRLVASSKRSTGKWLGGVGNIGLALCRLEMMTDVSVTDEPLEFDPTVEFKVVPPKDSIESVEALVKPFVPPWLRAKIEETKARRIKKKPKEEDDDPDSD